MADVMGIYFVLLLPVLGSIWLRFIACEGETGYIMYMHTLLSTEDSISVVRGVVQWMHIMDHDNLTIAWLMYVFGWFVFSIAAHYY